MNRDQALAKIKKCLALSRSANEHEAATALRQAQALMAQFNLREADVSMADVKEVRVRAASTAANSWEVQLVDAVAEAFGCEHFTVLETAFNPYGSRVARRYWVLVGLNAAADVGGYACDVLVRQCARARMAHIAKQPKNCKPATKTARGDAFAQGWVWGMRQSVERFAQPEKDQLLLEGYLQRQYGEMQETKVRDSTEGRKLQDGHAAAGFYAGQKAQLHRGVGGQAKQALLT